MTSSVSEDMWCILWGFLGWPQGEYVAAVHTVEAVRYQLSMTHAPTVGPGHAWAWGRRAVADVLATTCTGRLVCRLWRAHLRLPPFVLPALLKGALAAVPRGPPACLTHHLTPPATAEQDGELMAGAAAWAATLTWGTAVQVGGWLARTAWLVDTCTLAEPVGAAAAGLVYSAARRGDVPLHVCAAWLAHVGPSVTTNALLDAALMAALEDGNVPLVRLLLRDPRVTPSCNRGMAVRRCCNMLAYAEAEVTARVADIGVPGGDHEAAVLAAVASRAPGGLPLQLLGMESAWPTGVFGSLAHHLEGLLGGTALAAPQAALVEALVAACRRVVCLRECVLMLARDPQAVRAMWGRGHGASPSLVLAASAIGLHPNPVVDPEPLGPGEHGVNHLRDAWMQVIMEGVVPLHPEEAARQAAADEASAAAGQPRLLVSCPAHDLQVDDDSEREDLGTLQADPRSRLSAALAQCARPDVDTMYYQPAFRAGQDTVLPHGRAPGPVLLCFHSASAMDRRFDRRHWKPRRGAAGARRGPPLPKMSVPQLVDVLQDACGPTGPVGALALTQRPSHHGLPVLYAARRAVDALYDRVRASAWAATPSQLRTIRQLTSHVFHGILWWNTWWQLQATSPSELQAAAAYRRQALGQDWLLVTVPYEAGVRDVAAPQRALLLGFVVPPTDDVEWTASDWDALAHPVQATLLLQGPRVQAELATHASRMARHLWRPVQAWVRRSLLRTGCLAARTPSRLFVPNRPDYHRTAYLSSCFAMRACIADDMATLGPTNPFLVGSVACWVDAFKTFWALWGLTFAFGSRDGGTEGVCGTPACPMTPARLVQTAPCLRVDETWLAPGSQLCVELADSLRAVATGQVMDGVFACTPALCAAALLTCFPALARMVSDEVLAQGALACSTLWPLWAFLVSDVGAGIGTFDRIDAARVTRIQALHYGVDLVPPL
jgi:hypothetical protein